MKILIVEDELIAAEDLKEKLEGLQHSVTDVAESYDTALESIRMNKPDLALVDIELKGKLTGIDLSEELNKRHIPFVYLSGIRDLDIYYKANETGPLKNLAKPIDRYNLRNALLDIEASLVNAKPEIMHFFNDKNGVRKRIDPDQIVYLKAGRSYCDVYFKDGTKWTLALAMGKVFQMLNYPDIVQIHRSYCINRKQIVQIQRNKVQLSVGPAFKITKSFKDEFNEGINKI